MDKRTERGKIKLMSKQDMRKLGYRSPDVFDALLLTFVTDDEEQVQDDDNGAKNRIEENRRDNVKQNDFSVS